MEQRVPHVLYIYLAYMACEFLLNRTCLWLWENIYSWPTEQILNKAVNKESMAMQKSSLKNYL